MSNRPSARQSGAQGHSTLRFTRVNAIFLATGIASVAAGYTFLARGSTVAAPLLLVLGYAVLIPIGIVK